MVKTEYAKLIQSQKDLVELLLTKQHQLGILHDMGVPKDREEHCYGCSQWRTFNLTEFGFFDEKNPKVPALKYTCSYCEHEKILLWNDFGRSSEMYLMRLREERDRRG